ncbi:MAG: amidase [Actinomycetia bacterium]|nr:amidase [Actinomycetes bacterium]
MENSQVSALVQLPAHAIARAIAAGEISSREAVDAHIDRIEAVQPQLNAIVAERFADARAEADAADEARRRGDRLGVLHGVPVSLKDCLDIAGLPSTFGVIARRDAIATTDEVHVARLRAAGAIPVAKTNVAQFLAFVESDNPLHGRTDNPWNSERSCGGSSGGEAALIAACGSPLGLGTDIGGSARNPSAFCGIAGFKPSAGRMPDTGTGSFSLEQQQVASEVGVLARTTADIALALSVVNGAMPLGDPATVDIGSLRVAVVESDGVLQPCTTSQRAVKESAAQLAAAGAQVSTWTLPDPAEGMRLAFAAIGFNKLVHFADIAAGTKIDSRVKQLMQLSKLRSPVRKGMSGLLKVFGQRGLADGLALLDVAHDSHAEVVAQLAAYRIRFAAAMAADGIDAILLPASPLPAIRHGASKQLGTLGTYAILWNALGYPAGAVPWTKVRPDEAEVGGRSIDAVAATARKSIRGSVGLPIGVQLVAPHGQDHRVLALMETVEHASIRTGEHPGRPFSAIS